MLKQELLDTFREEFKYLLAQSEKNPKTRCCFADKRGGQGKSPCFMLDIVITTLCHAEKLIEGLDDSCPTFESLKQENKELRLLMFAFVRNSAVLPLGLSLGKSEQEITDKTFETIAEARKMLDVEKMRAAMNLATDKENRYDET